MLKYGVCVSCRISKPGGKRGKVGFGVFHASHGAAFPPRFYLAVLGAPRRRRCVCAARVRSSPALWGCWPKSDPPSKILRPVGPGSRIGRSLDPWYLPFFGSGFFPAALFAYRLAVHLDAVGVVHQPVENAVGQSRVPDLLVPVGDGQLAGEDHRVRQITVSQISRNSRRSLSPSGAGTPSSTISTSMRARRANLFPRLPSARASASSLKSWAARVYKAVNPSRHAFSARAQARKLFLIPVEPTT